jgi:mannosyltransferase
VAQAGRAGRLRQVDGVLAVTTVVAAALRFWDLGRQSLWWDEYITSLDVSAYFSQLWHALSHTEGSPPVFFYLEWVAVKLFGSGDGGLRVVSALAGIALVPVVYLIVRELHPDVMPARLAALLVAVNPFLIWYSQEARPYALLALFAGVGLLFFLRAQSRQQRRDLIAWSIASLLALGTHYFAVFIIAVEAAWLTYRFRRRLRELAVAFVPLTIGGALLLWLGSTQESSRQAWVHTWPFSFRVTNALRLFALGPASPDDRLVWIVAACAVLALGFGISRQSRARAGVALVAVVAVVSFALPLVGRAFEFDYFLGHNVIASLVPVIVVVAIGVASIPNTPLRALVAVVLCVLSVAVVLPPHNDTAFAKSNFRRVATELERGPTRRVVYLPGRSPLLRYLPTSRWVRDDERLGVVEVDVLSEKVIHRRACGTFVGMACAQWFLPFLSERFASTFSLKESDYIDGFVVDRYVARRPVHVVGGDFAHRGIGRAQDLTGGLVIPSQSAWPPPRD